ncbi:glycosyl hydrolase [Kitasatospora sp. NPDC059599]|uniref:glycosyl hydrolase n=1 Tax=Kitasatospora sp. NPDC059599 TaxID=3346880 RepID=UPI003695D95B
MNTLDFHLDGLKPADESPGYAYNHPWENDFQLISRHDVGERSFIIAFDKTATWDYPNKANIVSFDIDRDSSRGLFSMHREQHATFVFAQNWLINRSCPPNALAPVFEIPRPADELSLRVEDRIRRSGESLEVADYRVIDSSDTEGWSIAVDSQAKELPVRLFLETLQPDQFTYTVREGAFADHSAADYWLEHRSAPLPEPPEYRRDADALRTSAALARSTTVPAVTAAGVLAAASAATAALSQPDRGQSL